MDETATRTTGARTSKKAAVPRQRRQRVRRPDRQLVVRVGYEPIEASLENAPYTTYTTELHDRTAAADVPQLARELTLGDQ